MEEGSNEGHESLSDAAAEQRRASRIELSENEGQKLMRLLDDALVTPLEDEVVKIDRTDLSPGDEFQPGELQGAVEGEERLI